MDHARKTNCKAYSWLFAADLNLSHTGVRLILVIRGAPLAARIMAGLDGDCTLGQHPPALSAIITWLIDTG